MFYKFWSDRYNRFLNLQEINVALTGDIDNGYKIEFSHKEDNYDITKADYLSIISICSPGIVDKNNKYIFEGDIIKYDVCGKTYFADCPELKFFHFWEETEDNDTVDVVGNIYENKELISNKKRI